MSQIILRNPGSGNGRARRTLLILLCACAGVVAGSGCRSMGKSASTPLAAIDVHGNTPGQVRPVAIQVFQAHGYQLSGATPNELDFDKPGSRWSNLAYGSWVDEPTVFRVKLSLAVVGQTDCRLECRAFVVRDKGSATEEELPRTRIQRQPYREILQEIAARFGAGEP